MKTKSSLNLLAALITTASMGAAAQQLTQTAPTSSATKPGSPVALPAATASSEKTRPITKNEPPGAYVSPWLTDIVKLAKARIDDGVLLIFIDSAGTFNLSAEQIIFLRDLGISNDVIATMIQHDLELSSGLRAMPPTASTTPGGVHLTFIHNDSAPEPTKASAPSVASDPASASPTPVPEPRDALEALLNSPEDYSPSPIPPPTPRAQSTEINGSFSPVRKPYPVPVFGPIVFIRCESPTPNVVVVESP